MHKIRRHIFFSVIALFGLMAFKSQSVIAQEKVHPQDSTKCTNFLGAFRKGHFEGHVRNYFMATVNAGELSDYWTNATGGALKFETEKLFGFSAGVKGIFTFKTLTGDLEQIDPITGKASKWERELYDYLRPNEYADLDRMEELFIAWHYENSYIKYGKQDINTGPLLLRRDGRMKPFVYRGFWAEINEWEKHHLFLGWIDGVSPRGATEWFSINEAIGVNSNGLEPDGTKADYHESSRTHGIGVFGIKEEVKKGPQIQVWNYWFHNIMNTTWIQADFNRDQFYGGVQYVFQQPMKRQSSLLYTERFMQPDEQAHVLSGKIGHKNKELDLSCAYLHAFDTGRFLFPRELGREDFYVSQPRSWIDGFGDLNVYMLRFKYSPQAIHDTSFDLRLSYTDSPGTEQLTFNKYAFEDFYAATFLANHRFHGLFEGLEITVLYVGRFSNPNDEIAIEEKAYRYEMNHFNLIANINF